MPLLNYTTKVDVYATLGAIQGQLVKHGAKKIMQDYDDDGHITALAFMVDTPAGPRGIRLPANVDAVHAVLTRQVEACRGWGLAFDALNESLPDWIEEFGTRPRKVGASEYWDDKAVRIPTPANNPLTLEELRKMAGEPYWHVSLKDVSHKPHWALLPRGIAEHPQDYGYGVDWLAYRRKLEV